MPFSPELLQDLLDLERPCEVRLSPDGTKVVYATTLEHGHRKGEHTLSTLWRADVGKKGSAKQLTSGLFNDRSPIFAPDGDSVLYLSDRARASKQCAIYSLPLSGGEAYPITPAENEKMIGELNYSPCGKFIAFLSADEKTPERKRKDEEKDDAKVWGEDWEYARLRVVHVATKKITTLVSRSAHVVDFAWSPDGKAIAFAEAETTDIESPGLKGTTISVVDVTSKEIKKICKFPTSVGSLVWAGKALYFQGTTKNTSVISSFAVWTVDLGAAEGTTEATFTRCAHGDEDCCAALGKSGDDATVHVLHGLEDQVRFLNGDILFSQKKSIKGWDVASAKDGAIVAVAVGDTNHPTEVFTKTTSSDELVQLSNHGHAFADRPFGSVTFLSVQTADKKEKLDGLFITPTALAKEDGTPKQPAPTAVIIHGGPYHRNTDGFNTQNFYWTNSLLATGYAVMLPNYRGGSSHGERFAAYARGGMGTHDEADIVTMTNHIITKGYADKEKLIVGGYSQGGFLSYLSAVRNGMHGLGWKFKGAIPGAGVSDWDAMAMSSDVAVYETQLADDDGPWSVDKNDTSSRVGSALWEMKKAADKGGVIPPMLILHGEQDVRVPLEQARGFRRGLEYWKLPFEYVVYPREDHTFKERNHIKDMMQRVVEFVDRCLS